MVRHRFLLTLIRPIGSLDPIQMITFVKLSIFFSQKAGIFHSTDIINTISYGMVCRA